MTKQEAIKILKSDQSPSQKFMALLMALQQAPQKNFVLVGSYNRRGFSPNALKSLKYDVKKAFEIKDSDLTEKVKAIKDESLNADVKIDKEEVQKWLLEADLENLNYNKELKPLASDVSKAFGGEPESQKKVDLMAFLQQKKSDLSPAEDNQESNQ